MSVDRWTVKTCPLGHLNEALSTICLRCAHPLGQSFEVVRAQGARSSDPSTSKLAALKNQPRVGSQRAKVLAAITASGTYGLTAREAERESGVDRAGRRVSELKQGGHIVPKGRRADQATGAEGEVFIASRFDGPPNLF